MRELISKLLLAIDEAWLDHSTNIIYDDALSDTDERLERLLFEMESQLAGLSAPPSGTVKPGVASAPTSEYRPCRAQPQPTDSSAFQPPEKTIYQTSGDYLLLQDSRTALARSRALLVRVTTRNTVTHLSVGSHLVARSSDVSGAPYHPHPVQAYPAARML
jgi:hypothetical protein